MAKPRKACPLCTRMKNVTVQDCEAGCGRRYCSEHISWSEDLHKWVCDKCLRRQFGLHKGKPLPHFEEQPA